MISWGIYELGGKLQDLYSIALNVCNGHFGLDESININYKPASYMMGVSWST